MGRKSNAGIEQALMLVALWILCMLSLSFAQQPVRTPGPKRAGGPGVVIDPKCADATITGCFSALLRSPSGQQTWVEAIHAALAPFGNPAVPEEINGRVLMYDFGTYVDTPDGCPSGPPCTRVDAKLWDWLCLYTAPDPSAPGCFTPAELHLYATLPALNPSDIPATATIFCSGHSFLPDGKLLVTGGDYIRNNPDKPHERFGLGQGPLINYTLNALTQPNPPIWTRVGDFKHPVICEPGPPPNLSVYPTFDCNNADNRSRTGSNPYDCSKACVNGGRFYPTNVSLRLPAIPNPLDSVLVFSGLAQAIFPGSADRRAATELRNYTVEQFSNSAGRWTPTHLLYGFVDTSGWTYPRMHLFPKENADPAGHPGRIFNIPYNEPYSYLYDPSKNEATELSQMWTRKARPYHYRVESTSALFPLVLDGNGQVQSDVRVLSVGGSDTSISPLPILDSAERYSKSTNSWWKTTMRESYPSGPVIPREHGNAVLLPDGRVAILGGESVGGCNPLNVPNKGNEQVCPAHPQDSPEKLCVPVYSGQIFDPDVIEPNNPWTFVPAHTDFLERRPRQYHSTATLLPDGAVLLAGGDTDRACHCPGRIPPSREDYHCSSAQIYYPPYSFRGEGPTLQTAPVTMSYNPNGTTRYTFSLTLPMGVPLSQVHRVVLIRPAAVTHSLNQEQRLVQLNITNRSGSNCHLAASNCRVTVSTPANVTIAPPGYYMLFANTGTAINEIPSVAAFVQLQ